MKRDAATTLEYESPQALTAPGSGDCYRQISSTQDRLVMRVGAATPDRCIHCNHPAEGYRKRAKYAEPIHSTSGGTGPSDGILGLISFILLLLELIWLAASFATRKSHVVFFGVCPSCRQAVRRRRIVGVLLSLAGAAALAVGIVKCNNVAARHSDGVIGVACIISGVVAIVIGLIVLATASRLPRYDYVSKERIWLRKAGRPFLESLPTLDVRPADKKALPVKSR